MKTLSVSGKSSYLPSPARAFLTRCHFSQILFIRSESVSPAHAQKKRTEFYFLRGEILNSLCMCVQTTGILEDSRQRREKIGFQIGHRVCWYEERMFSFSPPFPLPSRNHFSYKNWYRIPKYLKRQRLKTMKPQRITTLLFPHFLETHS